MSPPQDVIKVLVVDDDALARQAICTILSADRTIHVMGEAADGEEACTIADLTTPQVVLMDIKMPRRDGPDALDMLLQRHPDLPVIMLTTFSDRDDINRALTAGASGFLVKTTAPDELVQAVRSAHRGGLVLSPSVARWVVSRWSPRGNADMDSRRRLAQLTPRQRDVLTELANGLSNAEIASRLHLSQGTIKGYVSEVIAALDVRNRVEAAIVSHRAAER